MQNHASGMAEEQNHRPCALLRGTIVNRTYGEHKYLYILIF